MGWNMEPVTIISAGLMGGGFMFGIWYIMIRKDAKLNMRPGMTAEGLRMGNEAPSFGRTKQEIDRKLAIVETRRRRRELIDSQIAVQEAQNRAAQEAKRLEEEAERERIRREQERLRLAEEERLRREEEERLAKDKAEQELARQEEDARLAREREEFGIRMITHISQL